jgi:hypothetical protein
MDISLRTKPALSVGKPLFAMEKLAAESEPSQGIRKKFSICFD